jgi:glycerol-3-phosphate acyltransferase PlsX
MNKIIIDCNSGDNGAGEIIKGVVEALNANKEINVVLIGEIETIKKEFSNLNVDINNKEEKFLSRIEIINAKKIDDTEEEPTLIVRKNADSSTVSAMSLLKERTDLGAGIFAGNTGVVLTAALLKLGRMKGISRPTLVSTFPTMIGGRVLLTDCGANVDSKAELQLQWALITNAYAKKILKIENPKVGLLNVGVEDTKGDERTKEVFKLLKARADNQKDINFIGNMESREYLSGHFDIIVADGFSGNVLMKATEGTGMHMGKMIKDLIYNNGVKGKLGGLMLKNGMMKIKNLLDFNNYGGANFLGCNKLVVKCHGASKAKSYRIAILETYDVLKANVLEDIQKIATEFNS